MNRKKIHKRIPKPLKDLTLLDRFLFDTAVSDPEICHNILSIIFGGREILALRIGVSEYSVEPYYDARAIRLDLLAFDAEGSVYNAEAQKENRGYDALCRRSRFYQAHIDVNLLEPGEVDFGKLNDVYVIFISPFDIFGKGKYQYTFRMKCDEVPDLELEDGAVRIFLNTKGQNTEEVSPELIEFLKYAEKNTEDESALKCPRVRKLADQINQIKQNQEVGVRYMRQWEEVEYARRDGRTEGLERGLEQGLTLGEMVILVKLVRKKKRKNLNINEIADFLEEDESKIRTIYELLNSYPDSTDNELAEILCDQNV